MVKEAHLSAQTMEQDRGKTGIWIQGKAVTEPELLNSMH